MARPPKPYIQLVTEKKSHRTKKELEQRKKGEEALLTGSSLKEWPDTKANPIAHKEFLRTKKLLKKISKDDALHEAVINRYCLMTAECKEFEELKDSLMQEIDELKEMRAREEIEPLDYIKAKGDIHDRLMACDRKIMDKRKMLLQIEKENLMTIMAALRAIPKKEIEKPKSPMAAFLKRKQEVGGNGS